MQCLHVETYVTNLHTQAFPRLALMRGGLSIVQGVPSILNLALFDVYAAMGCLGRIADGTIKKEEG
jgi:hypothetical protein